VLACVDAEELSITSALETMRSGSATKKKHNVRVSQYTTAKFELNPHNTMFRHQGSFVTGDFADKYFQFAMIFTKMTNIVLQ
jgi:hypothetical protein